MTDIDLLERTQRRATRMVDICRGKSYNERLILFDLKTLETRLRIRADLIEVYRVVRGMERVDESKFFTRVGVDQDNASRTRGNACKIFKKRFRLDIAKYSFGNRVANEWN